MALKVGELFASFGIDKTDFDQGIKEIRRSCSQSSKVLSNAGRGMTIGMTAPLVLGAKEIIRSGSEFSSQMSRVKAIANASSEDMKMLEKDAIKMGSKTVFTATEAGKAYEYMGMAGWRSRQMIAGLPAIINLSAASGEDLAMVSDIVTDSLSAFNLTADDAAMYADVLAAAATNSNTNVGKMGYSFKYAAPLAGTLGYTIHDTALMLGLMANRGIKAEQAGTSLRGLFTRLAKPTDEVASAMDALGVSLADSQGNMIPLRTLVANLRKSFSKLTKEQKLYYATALTGRHSVSGFLAIMESTDDEVNKLSYALDNSQGAAKRMSETALDNLKGDVVLFKSATEGLSISLQRLGDEAMRNVVQNATKLIDKFISLDEGTKKTIITIASVVAAVGPALLIGGKLLALVSSLASPIGLVTLALTGLGVAFAAASLEANKTKLSMEEVKEIVDGFHLPRSLAMEVLTEAKNKADSLAESFKSINKEIKHLTTKVELGFKLSGDNVDNLFKTVEEAITKGKETIEANKYQASLNLALVMGSNTTQYEKFQKELFQPFFNQVEAGAKSAGERARRALTKAMADGKISAEEAAQIRTFAELYSDEIAKAMMNSDIKVKILRLKDEGGLNPADIKNIIGETIKRTDEAFKTASESGNSLIDLAYRAAISLNYDEKQAKEYTNMVRKSVIDNLSGIKLEGFAATFNLFNDELRIPDFARQLRAWSIGVDGAFKNAEDALEHISTVASSSGIDAGFTSFASAMVQAMKPDMQKFEELKQSYIDLGLDIPSELAEVFRKNEVLNAMSDGMGGMFSLMLEDFSKKGKLYKDLTTDDFGGWFDEIAKFIKDDLTVPNAMKQVWGTVMSVTFSQISSEMRPQLKAELERLGADSADILALTIPQSIIDGINSKELTITEAAQRLIELTKTSESDAKTSASENASNAATAAGGIETGLESATESTTNAASALADETVLAASSLAEGLSLVGEEGTDGIIEALQLGSSDAVLAMQTLSSDVVGEALNQMSKDTGESIGSEFVNAIKSGITQTAGFLISAVKNVALSAKSTASIYLNASSGANIGQTFSMGIAQGIVSGISAITRAASAATAAASRVYNVPSSTGRNHYVSDPGRGTVYSSRETISRTAFQTAEAASSAQRNGNFARETGKAIADRLIASGALNGDVFLDNDKVGQKVTLPVSKNIQRQGRKSVAGRSLQGVLG